MQCLIKILRRALRTYSEPCHKSKMKSFAKIVSLKEVNYFCKTVHLRYLTRFWIRFCFLKTELLFKPVKSFRFKKSSRTYLVFCAIWYHLYNLKNVKNIHGRLKLTLLPWCFYVFWTVQMVPNRARHHIVWQVGNWRENQVQFFWKTMTGYKRFNPFWFLFLF